MAGDRRKTSDRRHNAVLAILLLAYVGCLAFYNLLTRGESGIPGPWPCNALLAIGLAYLRGWRPATMFAICAASCLLMHILAGDSPQIVAIYTICDMIESVLIALLIQRLFPRGPIIRSFAAAIRIVALALPIVVLMAALGSGASVLVTKGDWAAVFVDWLSSNALGMAVTLPAVMVLLDPVTEVAFRKPWWRQASYYGLVAVMASVAFGVESNPMPFLIFPVAMLAAFELGPKSAAWNAIIIAGIAGPLTAVGIGPTTLNALWDEEQRLRIVQAFVITIFFTCLASALVLSKQQRLKRLLIQRQMTAWRARERAQAASRAKTEFLATMSHEIRTPLNSILGFSSLLRSTETLSADGQRKLDLIAQAGDSLVTIVNDLLDFSRIEAGHVQLDPGAASPAALLRDAVDIITPEASGKGLVVVVEIAGDDGGLFAIDESRLRQVLLNLLNNAVKFTPSGQITARLSMTTEASPPELTIEIADTGIGIAQDQQERLFQRFAQADGSIRRSFGGTGLGLAICKALVSAMGGEIGVRSIAQQGSTFWLRLPVERADAPAVPAADAAPDHVARILLVDDHPMNRELGKALLMLAGCAVETADDGDEAVKAAAVGHFDLILMDIHMPRMDGLAASMAIRALPGRRGAVPIVAVSADVMPQQIERCRMAGMVDHVAKPIDRETLYAVINRWLAPNPVAA